MEEFDLGNQNREKTPSFNKGTIGAIIVIVVIMACVAIILIGAFGGSSSSSREYLTYENYMKIQTGMTYQQVVSALNNHQGELNSSSGYGGYTLEYYTWSNKTGTRCIVVGFENGKMCTKTQYGLK